MEHSPHFDKVKHYYESGLWGITAVKQAVVRGWITLAEFKEITGEDYEA